MPTGYISIGSNIERDHNVPSSLAALAEKLGSITCSNVYETAAIGFDGDAFYNLVVSFNSELTAKEVAKILREIELDHGRTRDSQKFSARTLDLDLLLYGDLIINDGRLQIPRKEIEHYAFVLEPLAEIAPNLMHPTLKIDYATLWKQFDKTNAQQVRINPTWLSTK